MLGQSRPLPSHRQSNMEITSGPIVQARAAHKSNPADEGGESMSVMTVSLDPYTEEEILVFIDHLIYAKNLKCRIEQQHQE